jgi:hypothetical protein
MPIPSTLEHQFSDLSTSDAQPITKSSNGDGISPAALVTPTKEDMSSSLSLASDEDDDDHASPAAASPGSVTSPKDGATSEVLQKTEQKLREERGELAPEPLLMSNPHRFVIFPIQDNEVRSIVVVDGKQEEWLAPPARLALTNTHSLTNTMMLFLPR